MVGFDLVGQEDLGRPLLDFAEDLMAARERDPNLNYYFHAGRYYRNWSHIYQDAHYFEGGTSLTVNFQICVYFLF